MPELPEVETVRRSVEPLVLGRTIVAVRLEQFFRVIGDDTVSTLSAKVVNRSIVAVSRRGKYLYLLLDDGTAIQIHLRMTGRLVLTPREEPPVRFQHLTFELDNGTDLRFADQRKFGRVLHVPAVAMQELHERLGPEPLAQSFSANRLAKRLERRMGRLKPVLLDQSVIGGLGNIYVDEALFVARLHPCRIAGELTPREIQRLHRAIRHVLRQGLANNGTTVSTFQDATGAEGTNAQHLRVYGRGTIGLPCVRCGRPISRIVVGGRGTHICLRCQPEAPPVELIGASPQDEMIPFAPAVLKKSP